MDFVEPQKNADGQQGKAVHDDSFSLKTSLRSVLLSVAIAFFVFVLISIFLKPTVIHGYSMAPTLTHGDRAIAMVYGYKPSYGDVIIIKDQHVDNKYIVKRIIGLPRDTINIDFATGEVVRNGALLEEPYLYEPTTMPGDVLFPLTVPEGHVFVMGDNRNNSTDSRTTYTGMIPIENIEGKLLFRLYPFENLGEIK